MIEDKTTWICNRACQCIMMTCWSVTDGGLCTAGDATARYSCWTTRFLCIGIPIGYPKCRNFQAQEVLAAPFSWDCACSCQWCRGRRKDKGKGCSGGHYYSDLAEYMRDLLWMIFPPSWYWQTRREGKVRAKALSKRDTRGRFWYKTTKLPTKLGVQNLLITPSRRTSGVVQSNFHNCYNF